MPLFQKSTTALFLPKPRHPLRSFQVLLQAASTSNNQSVIIRLSPSTISITNYLCLPQRYKGWGKGNIFQKWIIRKVQTSTNIKHCSFSQWRKLAIDPQWKKKLEHEQQNLTSLWENIKWNEDFEVGSSWH